MAEEKPLAYNMLLNGLLKVSSLIFPVIAFPYASRILFPEGIGKVSFATSVLAYFTMLAQMGIPTYGIQACAKARDNKEELSRTVHELLLTNLLTMIFSYSIFFVFLSVVQRLQKDNLLFLVMSTMVFLKVIGTEWLYQALEEYSYITITSLVFKIIAIPALFIMVRDRQDYIYYGILVVFASYAPGIINFLHIRKYIFIKPLGNYHIKRHIKQVVVLFAVSCATMVYTNMDTVMLGIIKNSKEVGYYDTAVNIKGVLVSLVTAAGMVLLPRMSYYLEKGMEKEFKETCKKAIHIMTCAAWPVAVYFIIFAKESINLVSGPAFAKSVVPMQIIMPTVLLIGLTNIIGIQVLVAMGRGKDTLYSVLAGAAADLVLNIILIPLYGAAGAAAGTLVAEIVVLLVQYNYIKELAGRPFEGIHWKKLIMACLASIIVSIWIKFLNIPVVFTLILSAMLFFGSYIGMLLLQKEPVIMEISCKAGALLKKTKNKKIFHLTGSTEMRKEMKQKNYYFRCIADDCINYWKIIVPFLAVCIIICGILGYQKANQINNLTDEQQEEVDIYNEQLAAYDKQIEESQGNIDIIVGEIENLQKYVDEALYMKLDAVNLQIATAQYAVTSASDVGGVLNSMVNYLAYGNVQECLEAKFGSSEAGYMRELLSWAINGNILNITVMHYDKEQGQKILETVQKGLDGYVPEIVKVYGEFSLQQLESTFYTKADNDVTNVQNGKLDTLKNYNISLADYNTRLASNKSSKSDYIENNKPEVMEASAPGNILVVKYAILGIIAGCVIPLAVLSLRYLLSDRIRSSRELMHTDMPVFTCYSQKENGASGIATGITELKLLAKKYQAEGFYLNLLSENEAVIKTADEITERFKENEISVASGKVSNENAVALESMIEKKYTVMVIKAGENTYPQLASQIRTCQKFGIPVWGCIVIE